MEALIGLQIDSEDYPPEWKSLAKACAAGSIKDSACATLVVESGQMVVSNMTGLGWYVGVLLGDGESYLVDESRAGGLVDVNFGGGRDRRPLETFVGKKMACAACKAFAETGTKWTGGTWKSDDTLRKVYGY